MTDNPNVDPEGVDVETCLAQLRDPATILAEALYRIHQADAEQAAILTEDLYFTRHDHLIRTADSLAYIANTAVELAKEQRQTIPFDDLDERAMQPSPVDFDEEETNPAPYVPQPVMGVRFTVNLTGGGYQYLGVVAGREWVHLAGYGFVDVGCFEAHETGMGFTASGRVVSATPADVLCITDDGRSVTLPRALITESADE